MNWVTIVIGSAAILYGLFTVYARHALPHTFKKLKPMKELWGERTGYVVHVIGYTVMPVVFGVVLVVKGIGGGSLF